MYNKHDTLSRQQQPYLENWNSIWYSNQR